MSKDIKMSRSEIKAQIKKDKARLKELRKLDKQNALSVDEKKEYVRLLNENTERTWKETERLQKVAIIILGLTGILLIVKLIVLCVLF